MTASARGAKLRKELLGKSNRAEERYVELGAPLTYRPPGSSG